MAVRDDFTAGEVLAAADLNDTFASKLPYSYGTATPSTTDSGFLWYDSNSTPAATKFWDGSAFVPFGGKIRQVVRATDTTTRSTTNTTATDTGITVTITPQQSTSAILLIFMGRGYVNRTGTGDERCELYVTDNSNNILGGPFQFGQLLSPGNLHFFPITLIGYNTPATTSATTYKIRFNAVAASSSVVIQNASATSQFYAIEVSA